MLDDEVVAVPIDGFLVEGALVFVGALDVIAALAFEGTLCGLASGSEVVAAHSLFQAVEV